MKMRQKLAAGAIAMLLATGPTWAMGDVGEGGEIISRQNRPQLRGRGNLPLKLPLKLMQRQEPARLLCSLVLCC